MIERPSSGQRAVLVDVQFSRRDQSSDFTEFHELAVSAGAQPVASITVSRPLPEPKYCIGKSKVEEIRIAILSETAEIVIVNHTLTPAQERNMERALSVRVVDRTGLILDIFATRARSFEGKLQVELAQLQHLATRLVRGWTHLERQKGGIGLRGPGETQLETDRRLLRERIKTIHKRLEKVEKQRRQGRSARIRAQLTTISLVGYTNAGKSTLFNCLTEAAVYAEDQLFATLDPILRRIQLNDVKDAILIDTVGFISDLPHELVKAFHTTLEETREAHLLLHVIDAANPKRRENIEEVETVLKSIEADQVPCIQVYNKIDLLPEQAPRIDRNEENTVTRVWISSKSGAGLDLLTEAITEHLQADMIEKTVSLGPEQGRLRAALYQYGAVLSESTDEAGQHQLTVRLTKQDYHRLFS